MIAEKKITKVYRENCCDVISIGIVVISLVVAVYFGDWIKVLVKLNLVALFLLVQAVYVGIRAYVKGCKRARGYYCCYGVRNIAERWIKVMGKLEKVIVENGITYVLGEDDIYYPDLQLPEGTNYNIGKFGHVRCEYLKEFKHGYYMKLLLDGRLNEYLHDIDEECQEMLDRIVEKMKEKQGVTEQLKAENQMLWVGKMNNIIACAEEVVVREVVYV